MKIVVILAAALGLSGTAFGGWVDLGNLEFKDHTGPECGISVLSQGRGPQCVTPQNPVDITFISAATNACAPTFANDSRCPVQSWQSARGAACGVESYKVGTDSVCGDESTEFWSDWGDSCPSSWDTFRSVIGIDSETRIHRSGFSVTTQTRHKCRGSKPKSCRNAKFGPETFKACAHSSFGAASYTQCQVGWQACRSPSHGEETRIYPLCENEAFGVTYKTCSLTLTNDEVGTWLTTIKGQAEFNIRNVANWAAQIHHSVNNVAALGCLISKTENNPLFDGDVAVEAEITAKMKSLFADVAGTEYVTGSYGCTDATTVVTANRPFYFGDTKGYLGLVCKPEGKGTAFCNAVESYKAAYDNLDNIRRDLVQVRWEFAERNALRMSEELRTFNTGISLDAGATLGLVEQGLKQ